MGIRGLILGKTLNSVSITSGDSPYTQIHSTDVINADTTGGPIIINLLPSADWENSLLIKNITGTNDITVVPDGVETIDGAATDTISSGILDSARTYYNNGTTVFISSNFELGAGGGVSVLDDLTDVTLTGPALNEVLTFDGAEWINQAITFPTHALNDITDVTLTAPALNQVLTYNGSIWVNQAASTGAFATSSNVTRNSPGSYANDDFVFGSPQLDDDGDSTHDARMFFDKSKAAFRVGQTATITWDSANVGTDSIGIGLNTTASGNQSSAVGGSGGYSTGTRAATFSGLSAQATNQDALVLGGNYNTASGAFSTCIGGRQNKAYAYDSLAVGYYSNARSAAEFTCGIYPLDVTAASATAWDATDLVFHVGNGTGTGTRADAFQIYKSGIIKCPSTTGAFSPPILTTAQRDALTAVAGMMIYNSTTNKHQGYDGSTWNDFY